MRYINRREFIATTAGATALTTYAAPRSHLHNAPTFCLPDGEDLLPALKRARTVNDRT